MRHKDTDFRWSRGGGGAGEGVEPITELFGCRSDIFLSLKRSQRETSLLLPLCTADASLCWLNVNETLMAELNCFDTVWRRLRHRQPLFDCCLLDKSRSHKWVSEQPTQGQNTEPSMCRCLREIRQAEKHFHLFIIFVTLTWTGSRQCLANYIFSMKTIFEKPIKLETWRIFHMYTL